MMSRRLITRGITGAVLVMGADGRPLYVTVCDTTDVAHGWRERKRTGGAIVHVPTGEVVHQGLAMPHSPRWHDGRLWVLESGRGRLITIDPRRGMIEDEIATSSGFARGLAFLDRFAFVGTSMARETAQFGDLPILDEGTEGLRCGIEIVDLATGRSAGRIEFEAGCRELFDVQVVPAVPRFGLVGFHKRTVNDVFVLPPETMRDVATVPAMLPGS